MIQSRNQSNEMSWVRRQNDFRGTKTARIANRFGESKAAAERPGGPSSVCQFVQVRRLVELGEDAGHREHEDAHSECQKELNILSFL